MTDVQVKVTYTSGLCTSVDAAALTLTMGSAGTLSYQNTQVVSLDVYFINTTSTTFTLTITGQPSSVIPYIGALAFVWPPSSPPAEPDPNFPVTGGCVWSKSGNQLTLVFHAPNLDKDGEWQLTDHGPTVPLTVKVKRRSSARTGDCRGWS